MMSLCNLVIHADESKDESVQHAANTCLLIVDVQKGFINDATKHIPALVEIAQNDYRYVVAARFFNPENSFFRSLIKWHAFSPGSDEIELAFSPRKDALIIDKSTYSCVSRAFLEWLKERNIRRVHVCGLDTDICVTKCAVDLFENGIEPVVLSKLCASFAGEEAHKNGLATLKRFIGDGQVV